MSCLDASNGVRGREPVVEGDQYPPWTGALQVVVASVAVAVVASLEYIVVLYLMLLVIPYNGFSRSAWRLEPSADTWRVEGVVGHFGFRSTTVAFEPPDRVVWRGFGVAAFMVSISRPAMLKVHGLGGE